MFPSNSLCIYIPHNVYQLKLLHIYILQVEGGGVEINEGVVFTHLTCAHTMCILQVGVGEG